MFALLRTPILELLRCPLEPPGPPAGSHESVVVFRAAPSYLRYRLLGMWLGLASFALLELVGIVALVLTLGLLGFALALALACIAVGKAFVFYVITRLDYEMRYYIITDRSLRIREGVVVIREITLTFENVQNMRIQQGPIQRLFGIHDLVVETAGGGAAVEGGDPKHPGTMNQGVFRGIGRPAELRDEILTYLRKVKTSGLGDFDDEEPFALPAGARPSNP